MLGILNNKNTHMKVLKFTSTLVKPILQGTKTSTWRMFDDKNLQQGDEISCVEKETGEEFAKASITHVVEKKLHELTDQDFEGHERYENIDAMCTAYSLYYACNVTPESIIKIVSFRLL